MISSSVQNLPLAKGMCNTEKYSALTKLVRACCSCNCDWPKTSNRVSHPLEGGVALVEMPADTTSPSDPILSRSCSKYCTRPAHSKWVLSCTGMPTDIV